MGLRMDALAKYDPDAAEIVEEQYADNGVRPAELREVTEHLAAAIKVLERFQREMMWEKEAALNDCHRLRAGHYSATADLARHVKQALQQLSKDVQATADAYLDAQED